MNSTTDILSWVLLWFSLRWQPLQKTQK